MAALQTFFAIDLGRANNLTDIDDKTCLRSPVLSDRRVSRCTEKHGYSIMRAKATAAADSANES